MPSCSAEETVTKNYQYERKRLERPYTYKAVLGFYPANYGAFDDFTLQHTGILQGEKYVKL